MLKKKVFIVPAILVTMNATSVFAGKDIAIMPAQEAVSGHATTGERRIPVPAEYQAIVIRPASE